jgi:hypothetical protein
MSLIESASYIQLEQEERSAACEPVEGFKKAIPNSQSTSVAKYHDVLANKNTRDQAEAILKKTL